MLNKKVSDFLSVSLDTAEKILSKAEVGGEINEEMNAGDWVESRLIPNSIFIDEDEYARMCIDALKILGTTAATDYGSSRQRDLGQSWADMTRGYLGEIAFVKFLKEKHQIDAELGHEVGSLTEYLPSDIHKVRKGAEQFRAPGMKIGIKTGKWNGVWLDIPGKQFDHSDIHVFVKVVPEGTICFHSLSTSVSFVTRF